VPNLIRLALDPDGLASLVANPWDVRSVFRERILHQLYVAPDAELAALYDDLLGPDPDDADRPSAEADGTLPMVINYQGHRLCLFSTITTFATPLDVTLAELVIEAYYPADRVTAEYFEASTAGQGPLGGVPASLVI
jgi:hypothetical protein